MSKSSGGCRGASRGCSAGSEDSRGGRIGRTRSESGTGGSETLPDGTKWDHIMCPICMEPPHNAVLLVCSSAEKGCFPLVCDTSKRHSNCLDQYRKAQLGEDAAEAVAGEVAAGGSAQPPSRTELSSAAAELEGSAQLFASPGGAPEELSTLGGAGAPEVAEPERGLPILPGLCNSADRDKHLACPLCRGRVRGWKVVADVRRYLNQRVRPCSEEKCLFTGRYGELRQHARDAHPTSKPRVVKPEREAAWKRLERQREMGDVMSSLRSSGMRGMIVGDYIIEEDDEDEHDEGPEMPDFPGDDGRNWTVFLLPLIFGRDGASGPAGGTGAALRRHLPRPRFPSAVGGSRRPLWGEPFFVRHRGRGRERDAMQEQPVDPRVALRSDSDDTEDEERLLAMRQRDDDEMAAEAAEARWYERYNASNAGRVRDAVQRLLPPPELARTGAASSGDEIVRERSSRVVEEVEGGGVTAERAEGAGTRRRNVQPWRRRRASELDIEQDWDAMSGERGERRGGAATMVRGGSSERRLGGGGGANGRLLGVNGPSFGGEPLGLGSFLAARYAAQPSRSAENRAGRSAEVALEGAEVTRPLAARLRDAWNPSWNGNRRWASRQREEDSARESERATREGEGRRRRRWDREFGAADVGAPAQLGGSEDTPNMIE